MDPHSQKQSQQKEWLGKIYQEITPKIRETAEKSLKFADLRVSILCLFFICLFAFLSLRGFLKLEEFFYLCNFNFC